MTQFACVDKMANEEAVENHEANHNHIAESPADETTETETPKHEHSGWLMKRTKLSHKWKKKWFVLKNSDLHYGDQEGVSNKLRHVKKWLLQQIHLWFTSQI